MNDPYLAMWMKAFAMTLLFEAPVCFALLRKYEPRALRLLVLVFFANLATHPAVWFIFPRLPLPRSGSLGLSEAFAFLAEALFYGASFPKLGAGRAIVVSAVANGVSWGLGYVLWPR